MNRILSICIPTYNRERYLEDGIKHLLPGIMPYEIPIYISDNGSIDGTKEVVRNLQQVYPLIFYSRNEVNRGADFNFECVLKMSETRYAWLMSDDDLVNIEYIPGILDILKKNRLDMMGLNGYCEGDVRVKDVHSAFYSDRSAFLCDVGWHLQWMSCLIMSRELIEQADFEKYGGTYLLQFGIIFDYLGKKKDIYVYWNENTIIKASLASFDIDLNPGWSDRAFFIFTKSWADTIDALPECYTRSAKDSCIIGHGTKSKLFGIKSLIRLSLRGDYRLCVLWRYRKYIHRCIKQNKIIMIMIAMLPRLNVRFYKFVKKVVYFVYERK